MISQWSTISFFSALIAFLLIFRNSLPFAWTIRMMLPFLHLRFDNIKRRRRAIESNNRIPSANELNPFQDQFTSDFRATIDECDFMGHLSNSSYPKNLDFARMQYSSDRLADFMLDGGWVPLGSTSFVFHNEIPILSKYKITSRIETWDDKWLYLRNEFHGTTKKGERILFCTSITKHCFKHGRKTIAPWFVLAYCGYSSNTKEKAETIKSNSTRSKELRQSLKVNPLQAYQKSTPSNNQNTPAWCSPDQWDVDSWENERKERMDKLLSAFF